MKILFLISFIVFVLPDTSFAKDMTQTEYEQLISFFLGGLTAIAFVIAASMRW